jgi:hypothetical protein
LAHSRKVDHQPTIASAEACKAVPSAAHGRENIRFRGGADRGLHISDIGAAGNQARSASDHAIPNNSRAQVLILTRTQQVSLELTPQRRANLFNGTGHRHPSFVGPPKTRLAQKAWS